MEPPSLGKRMGEDKEATTSAKKRREESMSFPLEADKWRHLPSKEKHIALRPWPESYDPSEPRVCKLRKMIRVLKFMDASIRHDSSSPPSLSVLRMYNRILQHANTCIFLYHREAACTNLLPNAQDRPEPTSADIDEIELDVHEKRVDALDEWLFVSHIVDNFLTFLKDRIASGTSNPPLPPSSSEEEVVEEEKEDDSDQDLLFQQQLLDIVYVLEKMAIQRKYAPPDTGEEIVCYKKIREWVISTLMYVHTKAILAVESPTAYAGNGKMWFTIHPQHFSACCSYGHLLATAFELIPQCISLIQRCNTRLKGHFSSSSSSEDQATTADDDYEGFSEGGSGIPSSLATQVQRISEAERKELEKYRLRTLQQILDKVHCFGKINVTTGTLPSVEEVRIYAQIENHVGTALLLAHTRPEYKHSSSGLEFILQTPINPDEVMDVQTREQHLREVLSLLEPLEFASLGVVPTLEEHEYYSKIFSKLFCRELKNSSGSLGIDFNDKAIDKKTVAMLGKELVKFSERVLCFFADVKLLSVEMVNTVWAHGSSTPLNYDGIEGASSDATISSEDGEEDQYAYEPERYFDWSSLESEQIKRAITIFQEASCIVYPIYNRLLDANSLVKSTLYNPCPSIENYETVAREINSAWQVINFQEEAKE